MSNAAHNQVLGEIIGSESTRFEVECHQLYEAPPFAGFVKVFGGNSAGAHFGVVTRVASGPWDATRVVQAHRLTPADLDHQKPHLASLLRTVFFANLIGFQDGLLLRIGTPPRPPRLHSFVQIASDMEIRSLTESPDFLRHLTRVTDTPLDDLLVGAINSATAAWGSTAPIVAWGRSLARLLKGDYLTLESVLERLTVPAGDTGISNNAGLPGRSWERPLPIFGGQDRVIGPDADPFEEV